MAAPPATALARIPPLCSIWHGTNKNLPEQLEKTIRIKPGQAPQFATLIAKA
jgi:hypothetical protein